MWPRCRLRSRAGKSVCKGWEYPLPLYVPSFYSKNVHVGPDVLCCEAVAAWSNAGSPNVERCKHVKSQATTVFFKLGKLRRVSTYVQHVWGIIGHVTAEAGNTVGTDGAPPQYSDFFAKTELLKGWSQEMSIFGITVLFNQHFLCFGWFQQKFSMSWRIVKSGPQRYSVHGVHCSSVGCIVSPAYR